MFFNLTKQLDSRDHNITQIYLAKLKAIHFWPVGMVAKDMVNINAAIASVLSQLGSIFSLKEQQRTTLKTFLHGKDIFALFPAGVGNSLIYQVALLVIWFADLIGRNRQWQKDGLFNHLPSVFSQFLPFSKRLPMEPSQMVMCNKASGAGR